MKVEGYKCGDRKGGQDLDHAKLVVSNIAKFHALSVILQCQNKIEMDNMRPYGFCTDSFFKSFLENSMSSMVNVIKTSWGSEWYIPF